MNRLASCFARCALVVGVAACGDSSSTAADLGAPDGAVADLASPDLAPPTPTPPTFAPATAFPVGTGPRSLVVADLDGDGKLDVATADQGAGDVAVLLGKGDGTFAAAARHAVGMSPVGLVVADFDGDHVPDLVTSNFGDGTLSLLVGKGGGDFAAAQPVMVGGKPYGVATADLDGDGKADLVVADNAGNRLDVLYGKGDGAFRVTTVAFVNGETAPLFVGVADLARNGHVGIVVSDTDASGFGALSVVLGTASGLVAATGAIQDGAGMIKGASFALADVNGDGAPDAVTDSAMGSGGAFYLDAFLGALTGGAGRFDQTPVDEISNAGIAVGDLNGDGKPDLVTPSGIDVGTPATGTVVVRAGFGDGHFVGGKDGSGRLALSSGEVAGNPVALADLDGDGKLDIVVGARANVVVLRNTTP